MNKVINTLIGLLLFAAASYGVFIYYMGIESIGSPILGWGAFFFCAFAIYYIIDNKGKQP